VFQKVLSRATPRLSAWALASAFLVLFPVIGPGLTGSDLLHSVARADDDDGGGGPAGPAGPAGGGGRGEGGGPGASGGGGEGSGTIWSGSRRSGRQNCFAFFCRPAKRTARRTAPPLPPAPREFVIWNASPEQIAAIENARFRILDRADMTNGRLILRVRAAQGTGRQTALRRIAELAPGSTAGENVRYRSILRTTSRGSGTPGAGRLLGEAVACSADIEVAMIDTGIDPEHPALAGARLTRLDMRGTGRQPSGTRHGTAVASLIVGVPEGPIPGIAPKVQLLAIDAFHRDASGADATDVFDLARALDLVASRQARVVNLSLTGPDNPVVSVAISALQERGKLVVAAAGNEGPRARPVYPAAYPGVIAVAAIDRDGKPWRHSARGQHIGFAAEGVGLSLAGRNGKVEVFNGTSFSAPIVTAMLAAKIKIEPGAGPDRFRDRLISLAADRGEPGHDPVFGHGALDPHDACRRASRAELR
jgi:hypothetical protein